MNNLTAQIWKRRTNTDGSVRGELANAQSNETLPKYSPDVVNVSIASFVAMAQKAKASTPISSGSE